jgi:4-amino-4-deoxy-L-arabinose transferase-like glycosyltransferase
VALLVATLSTGVLRVPALDDSRVAVAVIGALVAAMVLTPGLPGVLFRCVTGGNWRWWRGLRPGIGVPLLVVLVAWWVILAGERTNWELINQMGGVHFLARTTGFASKILKMVGVSVVDIQKPGGNDAMASYAKPPGFYLALVWVTFWPWSVLIVPAAFHAVRRVLGRTAIAIDPRPYQFLLAWIVPMWIALELSRGKLLHYPLPLYIPMAILCADALVQGWHRMTDVFASGWFGAARWGMLAIWMGMSVGALVAAKYFLEPELFSRCLLIAGALAAAGVAGAIAWGRPTWPMVTVMGWGVVLFLANTLLLPEVPALQLGKLAGQQMAQMKKDDPDLRLAAQGFEQPTLVFYAGQKVEMPYIDKDGKHVSLLDEIPFLPKREAKAGERFLLAVDDERLEYLRHRGDRYWLVGKATGVGFAKGKRVENSVFLIMNAPDVKGTTAPATAASGPATTRAGGE